MIHRTKNKKQNNKTHNQASKQSNRQAGKEASKQSNKQTKQANQASKPSKQTNQPTNQTKTLKHPNAIQITNMDVAQNLTAGANRRFWYPCGHQGKPFGYRFFAPQPYLSTPHFFLLFPLSNRQAALAEMTREVCLKDPGVAIGAQQEPDVPQDVPNQGCGEWNPLL